MFYYISGRLAHLDPSFAVVDAGGVGYKLTISGTTHAAMPPHLTPLFTTLDYYITRIQKSQHFF